MPTQDQIVDLPLVGGLDSKSDSKLDSPTSMSVLKNAVYRKNGRVDKSKGFDNLISTDCDGNTIDSLNFITSFKSQLIGVSEKNSYSYTENVGWTKINDFASADIDHETLYQDEKNNYVYDQLVTDSIRFVSWIDESGDCFFMIKSLNGNTLLNKSNISPGNTVTRIRFLELNNSIYIFYYYSLKLYYKKVPKSNPCILGSEVEVANSTDIDFDVHTFDNIIYIFHRTTGGFLASTAFTSLTSPSTALLQDGGNITADDNIKGVIIDKGVSGAGLPQANLVIAYSAGSAYKFSSFDIDYNLILTTTSSGTHTAGSLNTLFLFEDAPVHIFDTPNADERLYSTSVSLLTDTGAESSFSIFKRGVGLASQGYSTANNWYVNVRYSSELQPVEFVLNSSGIVVAKILQDRSADLAREQLPIVNESDGMFYFATGERGRLLSTANDIYSNIGIAVGFVDFDVPFKSVDTGENLLITAGLSTSYDGVSFTELGFNLFPETLTTTGGSGTACFFTAIYRWIDSAGRVHRSSPTIPVAGLVDDTSATVQSLHLTNKTNVTIEVYRTVASAASGTISYKCAEDINDDTANTTTVTITPVSDANLVNLEILYTDGGIIPNVPPESATVTTTYRNRVFNSGLGDGNKMQYSKIIRRGEGVSFAEDFFLRVDSRGGDIVAHEAMDSNLVIFKRDNIYVLQGDGPDDTGVGNFTEPEIVTTDVGCISLRSVVIGPNGIYFQSAKGIYLLERNLGLRYIGDRVEDQVQGTIIESATLLEDQNEIRFTNTNQILVYNYYYDRWSSIDISGSSSSTNWNGRYVVIQNGVAITTTDNYLNFGAFYGMDIRTGWMKLSSIQGYQRVKRLYIIGEYKSNHKLLVTVYRDYSETVMQHAVIDPSSNLTEYGTGVYGVESPYGGLNDGVYQYEIHVRHQKCQALSIRIQDIYENTGTIGSGEALNLIGFSARVGVKRGGFKLPSTKKV